MIHNSASSGYRQNSHAYLTARPSYHPRLLERFRKNLPKGRIVDLGAGTGIFTQQLVEEGYAPIAIEPVSEMRTKLRSKLPTIEIREGTAEETGLATSSVDAVVAAQAFHWFNYKNALAEIKRILVPGGLLVCAWNVRDEHVEWVRSYEAILNEYEGNTPRHRTMEWRKAIDGDISFKLIDEWSVPNSQPSSPKSVIDRALSTSFIGALDADTQHRVLEKLRNLVSEMGETFTFPYISEIQVWQKMV